MIRRVQVRWEESLESLLEDCMQHELFDLGYGHVAIIILPL